MLFSHIDLHNVSFGSLSLRYFPGLDNNRMMALIHRRLLSYELNPIFFDFIY